MRDTKHFMLGGLLLAGGLHAQQETGSDRVNTVNPRYDLVKIRPSSFQPRVTAMALRPDGKLVVVTAGQSWAAGTGAEIRSMYLLDGVEGADPEKITVKKIAGSNLISDPMGLVILDGAYYLTDKDDLIKVVDNNGDEVLDAKTSVGKWKYGNTGHEFAFGPVYKDGFFYVSLSVQLAGPGPSAKVQNADERGTVVKMNATTGAYTVMAGGLRTPNGIGLGPKGEIFVTDNQGSWLPSCKLLNIRQGRTYGHMIDAPVPVFQNQPVSPPVVWTPHADIGRSPGEPALMTTGPYAGQMVFGDLSQGGVKRVFLEEVDGEYQGAIMPLSGGLESGMHRIIVGKDGSMYLGGIGNGDLHNWGWMGTKFGLQKLKPNGKSLFEILAVRSRRNGMEIEFTEPIAADYDPAKVEVFQWWYEPTYTYGGPKKDVTRRVIRSRQISPDGKSLFLEVEGLKTGQVTHIKAYGIKSKSGLNPWFNEAWYTLNAISKTSAFDNSTAGFADGRGVRERRGVRDGSDGRSGEFRIQGLGHVHLGRLGLQATLPPGAEDLEIRDMRGALVASRVVRGETALLWNAALPGPGLYLAVLRTGSRRQSIPFTAL